MSLPRAGNDCLLRIRSEHPPFTYELVEGLRLTCWMVKGETVEVTDLSDAGWSRLLSGAGLRSTELKIEGLYLRSGGEIQLRRMALSGMAAECDITLDTGESIKGAFVATELRYDGGVNEEVTYAATLRSAGPITVS